MPPGRSKPDVPCVVNGCHREADRHPRIAVTLGDEYQVVELAELDVCEQCNSDLADGGAHFIFDYDATAPTRVLRNRIQDLGPFNRA